MNQITESTFTPELKAYIFANFAKDAIDKMGFDGLATEPVSFEIRDEDSLMGVCVCQIFWGQLHIKYLVVDERQRGRGLGRKLMEYA